jgi:hypothetical protein
VEGDAADDGAPEVEAGGPAVAVLTDDEVEPGPYPPHAVRRPTTTSAIGTRREGTAGPLPMPTTLERL